MIGNSLLIEKVIPVVDVGNRVEGVKDEVYLDSPP